MKKLLAMICLVLVLGCTGGGTTNADEVTAPGTERGYGLKIIGFESDMATVSSGRGFNLVLQLKNVGNHDATTIKTKLYKKGKFEAPEDPTSAGATALDKADTELNLPGGSTVATWTVTAPKVSTDYTSPLGVRVTYDYGSEGRSDIAFMSEQRYNSLQQKGEPIPVTTSDSSVGPIEVKVQAPELIVAKTSPEPFTIRILLQNVGDGVAFSGDKLDKVGIVTVVRPEGVDYFDDTSCKGTGTGDTNGKFTNVQLIGGKNAYLTCKLKKTGADGGDYEDTSLIKVTATYTYQTEAETTVTVTGQGIQTTV